MSSKAKTSGVSSPCRQAAEIGIENIEQVAQIFAQGVAHLEHVATHAGAPEPARAPLPIPALGDLSLDEAAQVGLEPVVVTGTSPSPARTASFASSSEMNRFT